MIYLQLFVSFVKIGFTSFGGMSMVPVIMEEMLGRGWMSAADVTNIIAIAEMTPGSLGVNCATFAGTQTAGVLGGIVAVLGVLTPAFTLTMAAAIFFRKFRDGALMKYVLRVVKPVCIAMIVNVILTLSKSGFFREGKLDFYALGIFALSFYLIRFRKWSVPLVISTAAGLGVVCYGVL